MTARPPYELECPECNDINPEGCKACNGEGRIIIEGCPLKDIPPETFELLDMADLYEKGILPATGGYHNQPAAAMDGIRLISGLRIRARAALMKREE